MTTSYTGPLTPQEWQTIAETKFQMRRAGVNLIISRAKEAGIDINKRKPKRRKAKNA